MATARGSSRAPCCRGFQDHKHATEPEPRKKRKNRMPAHQKTVRDWQLPAVLADAGRHCTPSGGCEVPTEHSWKAGKPLSDPPPHLRHTPRMQAGARRPPPPSSNSHHQAPERDCADVKVNFASEKKRFCHRLFAWTIKIHG